MAESWTAIDGAARALSVASHAAGGSVTVDGSTVKYLAFGAPPSLRQAQKLERQGKVIWIEGEDWPRPPNPGVAVAVLWTDVECAGRLLRALRRDPSMALVPVLVSESLAGRTELAGLADAAADFDGEGPFPETSFQRIEGLRAEVARLAPLSGDHTDAERRAVLLLRYVLTRHVESLDPVPQAYASKGYEIPIASALLDTASGDEISVLAELAGLGLFRGRFRDRVHVCPYCDRAAISFREVCGTCRSANLAVEETVHHFRCGHVAPERSFRRGGDLVCPKCSRLLRHVGVDYDRPNQVAVCEPCGALNTDPEVECLCFSCRKLFTPEFSKKQDIRSYSLTLDGAAAAEKGALPARSLAELLREAFRTVTRQTFEDLLRVAASLRARHGRTYQVVRIAVENCEELAREAGSADCMATLRAFVELLKGILRETDVILTEGEAVFRVLFLETEREGVERALERVTRAVSERVTPPLRLRAEWVQTGS
ncbi:MAG: hypothetical protein HY900_10225 [Deltaproteobacteria bacterium]|nr:hypothetical protein [Deltaproteobacteria bacterium]